MKRDPKTDGLVAGKDERKLNTRLVSRRLLRTRWTRLGKAPQPAGPSSSANSFDHRQRSVAACLARFSDSMSKNALRPSERLTIAAFWDCADFVPSKAYRVAMSLQKSRILDGEDKRYLAEGSNAWRSNQLI